MGYYGGLTINGAENSDSLGRSVTNIGDMNGDGIDDVAISTQSPVSYYDGDEGSRAIYVIFGAEDGAFPAEIDVGQLDGSDGFQIKVDVGGFYGGAYGAGRILTNVGDLNGDGVDDLGIGGLNTYYDTDQPGAFVLFGNAGGFAAEVIIGADMSGTDGFGIIADAGYRIVDMDAAGDINGDGLDDLLINQTQPYGYYGYYGPSLAAAAAAPGDPVAAYVIFGDDATGVDALGADGTVDVADLDGTNGFGIVGGDDQLFGEYSEAGSIGGGVISLGDVNGDGFSDLGLQRVNSSRRRLPDDLDGDGNPDVDAYGNYTYTTYYYDYGVFSDAFVLFGGDTTDAFIGGEDGTQVYWDDLSRGGYYDNPYDAGFSEINAAGIGDINGDGFDDVAIGTRNRVLLGEFSPVAEDGDDAWGVIGIVYGGPDGVDFDGDGPDDGLNANVSLAARFADGSPANPPDVTIVNSVGPGAGQFGLLFEAAGDVNGDGIGDLLISNPGAPDSSGNSYYGETFLVFGRDSTAGETLPAVLDLDNLSQAETDQTFYRFFQEDDRFSGFGYQVSAAGDLNGDGFGDLIIGHPYTEVYDATGEDTLHDAGKAYVIFGGADALEAADNADGANDNSINVANLNVDALTGAVPVVVSVANSGFRAYQVEGTGGSTVFSFEVQRTGDLTEVVSFTYAVDGDGFSPANADDFVGGALPSGSVTFAAGEAKATVDVMVNGDADIESDEDFSFTLTGASTTGASVVSLGVTQSLARIGNDDFPASVHISSASTTEGGALVFTVSRFNDSSATITVDFAIGTGFNTVSAADIANVVVDGTSLGGGLGQTGTLTFAPGETSKQIVLDTFDDVNIEGQEYVRVGLSNLGGDGPAVFSNTLGTGYITDNDFAPEIFVQGGGSFSEGSGPGFTPVTFEIVRRGDTTGATEVHYDLNPLPSPGDFFAANSQDIDGFLPSFGNVVRFEDGESVKSVTVNIIRDGIIEPREQFELRITQVDALNGVSYNILNSSSTVTIRNDDGRPPVIPDGVEADVYGDPHIVTLDGLGYDFQAVGEYVLVESTIAADPRDFQVQVRFEPLPGSDLVSVTTRLAVNIGDKIVEIDALGSDPLMIDGVALTTEQIATGAVDVDGDGTPDIFFDAALSGFTIVLNDLNEQLMVKNMGGVLNACVFLSDAAGGHAGNVQGLMGNANGDLSDDLMSRDGATTYTDPTFAELYVDYADSWKVTSAERGFSDAEGAGDFPDGFPAAKISIADLPGSVLAAAEAAVDAAGITDPILRESAILDFALTGDDNFIQGALGLAADPTEEVEVTDAPEIPLTIGVTPVDTVVNEADGNPNTLSFTFYRIGDSTDAVVIDYAIGGDVDAADLVAGTALTGQVTIPAGQGSATLNVGVLNDDATEASENLIVSITGNDQGALVASAHGTTLIETDDFAPVAVDDVFSISENAILTGNVLGANPTLPDVDANGDTLTVVSAKSSSGAALAVTGATIVLASGAVIALGADGSFTYDPTAALADFNSLAAGEFGSETFTYMISDGHGGMDEATATINVTGVDDAPVAEDDDETVDEDVPTYLNFVDNDVDPEGAELEVTITGGPSHGSLEFDGEGWIYQSDENFNGDDSFTYTVSDGDNTSNEATVSITVNPINDAPVAANSASSIVEDGSSNFGILGLISDPDGDPLSIASLSVTAGASVVAISDTTFTITGDPDFNGPVVVTYSVTDGELTSNEATIAIEVTPVNDAPELDPAGPFLVDENTTAVGTMTASDADGDDLTFSITGGADADLFDIDADTGALSFAVAPDFEDPDHDPGYEVQVAVSDGELADDELVFVTVQDVDDGPVYNEVFGADYSDRVTGTEGADIINSGEGRMDVLTGLGGGDIFDLSTTADNGLREIRRITDFNADEDSILLDGAAGVLTTRDVRGSTYLFLDGDRDVIILEGVSVFDTDSLL